MKYMHFNSSCSYAGLANQLEMAGINTEDTEIAITIGLPYCIEYQKQNHTYLAGAMLQGKWWFDRYLSAYGKEYQEMLVPVHKLLQKLKPGMMLGIQTAPGQKHAVVFIGKSEEGNYLFLNNKWEGSKEPEQLCFSEEELLGRVPEEIMLGFLKDAEAEQKPMMLNQKVPFLWEQYLKDITAYIVQNHSTEELRESRDPLFRPLFVDALAMMQIINEEEMVRNLKKLQGQYMEAVRKNRNIILSEELDVELLRQVVEQLIKMSGEKLF